MKNGLELQVYTLSRFFDRYESPTYAPEYRQIAKRAFISHYLRVGVPFSDFCAAVMYGHQNLRYEHEKTRKK